MLTLAGGAEVVSLASLGLFLFPTLLLEKDPAVDQFLKGEIMMVHQVEAAASSLGNTSSTIVFYFLTFLFHQSLLFTSS